MWVYRNRNTGQTVKLPERDPILECWPNWVILARPAAPEDSAAPDASAPSEDSAASAEPESAAGQAPVDPPVLPPGPPPEAANKATWVLYAVSRGMPEKDAKALSKAALVEEFGQEEESDG